jgi:hypothetical protein
MADENFRSIRGTVTCQTCCKDDSMFGKASCLYLGFWFPWSRSVMERLLQRRPSRPPPWRPSPGALCFSGAAPGEAEAERQFRKQRGNEAPLP